MSLLILPLENVLRKRFISDYLASFIARKLTRSGRLFAPTKQPRLAISYRNEVEVDYGGLIQLTTVDDYKRSVREPTWRAVQKFIKEAVDRKLRIVFFSATPQGGGVALMRHALLRFLQMQGVDVEWSASPLIFWATRLSLLTTPNRFVPKPRPDVFRITKTNHNILQGAVDPKVRATDEQLGSIKQWIVQNAERYWLGEDGPLRAPADGGADVIIIDDPQMPALIPLAKKEAPDRPIIFRSHIEVRDDLVHEEGSAAQHVWRNMWANIQKSDVFISHPVRSFVPSDVRKETVGWLPATTDW